MTHGILPTLANALRPISNVKRLNGNSFSARLPYRTINPDLLFLNEKSVGFGLKIAPTAMTQASFITTLLEFFQHNLPEEMDCTVLFYTHPYIHTELKRGLQPFLHKGGIYADFASAVVSQCARDGKIGILYDYRCYLFVSTRQSMAHTTRIMQYRCHIEAQLNRSTFVSEHLNETDFLVFMRSLMTPTSNTNEWPAILDIQNKTLNQLVAPKHMQVMLQDTHLNLRYQNQQGLIEQTQLISCQLRSWPSTRTINNFVKANLNIPCHSLISVTLRGSSQPQLFYNLLLFTTKTRAKQHLNLVINHYQQLGFKIQPSLATQWLHFLASLPFFFTEHDGHELKLLKVKKPISLAQLQPILPFAALRKGSFHGLLIPTIEKQLFFINTFDHQNLRIRNFNYLIATPSNRRDDPFINSMIMSALSLDESICIIDTNQAYQNLCHRLNGHHIHLTPWIFEQFTTQDLTDNLHQVLVALTTFLNQTKRTNQLMVFDLHGLELNSISFLAILTTLLSSLFEQFKREEQSLKKRCIIDQIQPHLLNHPYVAFGQFMNQKINTASSFNIGFSFITNSLSAFTNTKLGLDIVNSCALKFIINDQNKEYHRFDLANMTTCVSPTLSNEPYPDELNISSPDFVIAHSVPISRGVTAGSTDLETSLDPAADPVVKPQEREVGYEEKPEQLPDFFNKGYYDMVIETDTTRQIHRYFERNPK